MPALPHSARVVEEVEESFKYSSVPSRILLRPRLLACPPPRNQPIQSPNSCHSLSCVATFQSQGAPTKKNVPSTKRKTKPHTTVYFYLEVDIGYRENLIIITNNLAPTPCARARTCVNSQQKRESNLVFSSFLFMLGRPGVAPYLWPRAPVSPQKTNTPTHTHTPTTQLNARPYPPNVLCVCHVVSTRPSCFSISTSGNTCDRCSTTSRPLIPPHADKSVRLNKSAVAVAPASADPTPPVRKRCC